MKQKYRLGIDSVVASTLLAIMTLLVLTAHQTGAQAAIAGQENIVVTELYGTVAVTNVSGTGERVKPVALLESVEIGAVLRLTDRARLVVFYTESAAEYHVQGPASYRVTTKALLPLGQASLPVKKELHAAYRGVKVQANSLVQAGIVLRASGKPGDGMRPANEQVDPANIRFRWSGTLAAGTRIELSDEIGEPVWDAVVTASPMALPAEVRLVAGKTYRWLLVLPNASRGRQIWAEFAVLPADISERIRQAVPRADAPISEQVAFALLLEKLEANSMAEDIWAGLVARQAEVGPALKNRQGNSRQFSF